MGFLKRLFGKKATPTPPQAPTPSKRRERSYPDFPEGDNHVDDPDVKTLDDLKRYYVLPKGHEYRVYPNGSPYVLRLSDGMEFKIVIEEGLMTIDEPYTRESGKVGYKTTEIFKKG